MALFSFLLARVHLSASVSSLYFRMSFYSFIYEKNTKKEEKKLPHAWISHTHARSAMLLWLWGGCSVFVFQTGFAPSPSTPPPLSLPTSILLLLCVYIWVHCLLVHAHPSPYGPCRWWPLIFKSVGLQPPILPYRLGMFTCSSVKSTVFRNIELKTPDMEPEYVFKFLFGLVFYHFKQMTFHSCRVCFVIAPEDFASPLPSLLVPYPVLRRLVPQPLGHLCCMTTESVTYTFLKFKSETRLWEEFTDANEWGQTWSSSSLVL